MARTTTDTKLDLKNLDLRAEAARTFYAGAGVADLAVSAVRDYVAQVQKNVSSLELEPQALRAQAATAVASRVEALGKDAKERRAAVEARMAELQAEARALPDRLQGAVDDNVATLVGTYGELAKRGEELVARIRRQQSTKEAASAAKTTTAKARTTRTQGTKAAKSTAKKASTTAKKSASTTKKTAAKKSTAPRSSAKATATAAKKTASAAGKAAADGAAKVGD